MDIAPGGVKGRTMSNATTPVNLVTTGGTIEKIYDESDGTLGNRASVIKSKILQKLRLPYMDIRVHALMSKDSLEMDQNDREAVCAELRRLAGEGFPIVILHGTDTMDLTARYCLENFPAPGVPVVFTGAMRPMGFDDSDATQNVVEALFAARLLTPGYWATFHNQLYAVPRFRKNRSKGTFESL